MAESSKQLVEKWQPLLESEKAKPVKNKEVVAQLLENQETWLNENSSTALSDISQYTPILVPAVRRIVPNLLANEIVGVQALNGPTGYAFALRFGYEGAGGKKDLNGQHNYPNAGRGLQQNSQAFLGFAVVLDAPVAASVGDDVFIADGTKVGSVAHIEPNKVMIDLSKVATHYIDRSIIFNNAGAAVQTVVGAGTLLIGAGKTPVNPIVAFNNEAGYNLIFSSYFQYNATGVAEYMTRDAMKSMKMTMERFAVEAQTRKLKAEYSIELAQDLKNVHGMDAEAELINILEYEISAELDRELVQTIYQNCTNAGTWSYGTAGVYVGGAGAPVGVADGRNEMEKFRTLYTRIVREANAVALATRRGAANFIICSLNVASALQTLSNFMYSAVPGNVETTIGVAKIGTLDGRFTVYLDTFAYTDFFVVGYKGNSAFDSGIIYCPYVPLMIQKVVDPVTFQPLVGMQCRDAIVGNMWGAEKYYRMVQCNFAGSSLVQSNYYI